MSNPLMNQAAGSQGGGGLDLQSLVAGVLQKKWVILLVACVVLALAAFWTVRQPKVYRAILTLEYDPTPTSPLAGSEVEDVGNPVSNYWVAVQFFQTQNLVLRSRSLAEKVEKKLSLGEQWGMSPESAAQRLMAGLKVVPIKDTRLIEIKFDDTDPERAALIVNTLVDTYIEKTRKDRVGSALSALEWLGEQVDTLTQEVAASERELHDFKKNHNVLSLSMQERQNIVANEIQEFSLAEADARRRAIAQKARLQKLKTLLEGGVDSVPLSALESNSPAQGLRVELLAKQADLAALSAKYGENHPDIVALTKQVKTLEAQLADIVHGMVASAEAELQETHAIVADLRSELDKAHRAGMEVNLWGLEYSRLNREHENTAKLQSLVSQRAAETELAAMLQTTFARIVDRALPVYAPVKPMVAFNLLAGLTVGLILGVLMALLFALLDRRVKRATDVEHCGVPVLGFVPALSGGAKRRKGAQRPEDELFAHSSLKSAAAEAIRGVRTNLTFMATASPIRTLLVTSPNPGEGKTTVACNLAVGFAQGGKRVLLVDSDMRLPRAHRVFGLNSQVGLTNALLGDPGLDQAMQDTGIKGLSFLACGPIPPNPSELLHSEGFHKLLAEMRERFDLVIFDSPPLTVVSDPAVLAPQVDGTLLVVRQRLTTRDGIRSSSRILSNVHASLVGAVMNDTVRSKEGYGYVSGYSYYYSRPQTEEAAS